MHVLLFPRPNFDEAGYERHCQDSQNLFDLKNNIWTDIFRLTLLLSSVVYSIALN